MGPTPRITMTLSSPLLRDFREADAARVSALALAAFDEFKSHYTDWPALAAIYGDISGLIKNGEIIVAEIQNRMIGAVAYIPPGRPKASYFQREWPVIRMLVVDPSCRGSGIGRALTARMPCQGQTRSLPGHCSAHEPDHDRRAAHVPAPGLRVGT